MIEHVIDRYSVRCKLIGIHGHAGSGKDTVGSYLHSTRDNTWKLSFADPLKEAASKMFGIPEDDFYDSDVKERPDPFWNVSPRQVAQFFGTEMVRETIHRLLPDTGQKFWIERMVHRLTGYGDDTIYDEDDVVVICDVRFQNEYQWIIENGGIIIHLTRPGAEGTVGIPSHQSESGIDSTSDRSYFVNNDSTLEELYARIDSIVTFANIYPLSNPDAF